MKTANIRDIINNIDLFGIYEDYNIPMLINVLKELDNEYYNNGESSLPDDIYDEIKKHVQSIDPNNAYLKVVGSEVRGGKVKLPFTMGSLNQVYVGEIEEWVVKNGLENELIVITDKLDGTSGLVEYDAKLKIGYSRGDGIEGADITRHLRKMYTIPKITYEPMSVRGENIISHKNFPQLQKATAHLRNKAYANARNAVAGIMNSKENPDDTYRFIDFVAYDIVGDTNQDKIEMLMTLEKNAFDIPKYTIVRGYQLTDEFLTNILNTRRTESSYQIDGLVLDINSAAIRATMNKNNADLNPVFSIKYKVADIDNVAEAVVEYVEWNASKHGYLKPRIRIEPIPLCGVTVTWTQGFNAKFIKDNNIGPGTILKITRTGDVIPHVVGGTKNPQIVLATHAQMPDEDYIWNETGVDIILTSMENRDDVAINQLIDFFTKLKVPGLKEGNITALVQAGYTKPESIIKLDLATIQNILNSEIIGERVYEGIRTSLINVPFERLMGAYSTSRGIGIRRVNSVYKEFGLGIFNINDPSQLLNIEGIQEKTANKVMNEIILFREFTREIADYFNFADKPVATAKTTGLFANQHIVVTGFRDSELEKFIESNGGTMQSGVNKKTTLVIAANPNENSGKIKKAKDLNVDIISLTSFQQEYRSEINGNNNKGNIRSS